ncbi:hypothetical protein V3C99_014316 [Haemonchus contortus]
MLIPISIACFALLAPAYLEASYCPGNNNGMTDEIRQIFVDKHNEYRSIIAKGQAKNKLGGFAPKAARMLKVVRCEAFSP